MRILWIAILVVGTMAAGFAFYRWYDDLAAAIMSTAILLLPVLYLAYRRS